MHIEQIGKDGIRGEEMYNIDVLNVDELCISPIKMTIIISNWININNKHDSLK